MWCQGSSAPSCVYNQSCVGVAADTCPSPQITQVSLFATHLSPCTSLYIVNRKGTRCATSIPCHQKTLNDIILITK